MNDIRHTIDPSREGFKQMFEAVPTDSPVLMLNLVRFNEAAADETGSPPRTGREAYGRYLELFTPLMKAAGGRICWSGAAHYTLIAPPGERWDDIVVVEYPRIDAFSALIRSAAYKAILHHRIAGISDTRLIVTSPMLRHSDLILPGEG